MDPIYWLIAGLIGGLAAGILTVLLIQKFRKPQGFRELERQHKKLQEEVAEHFIRTADLVNDMTDSYKRVFDHLNEGANRMVEPQLLRERLPQDELQEITLRKIGASLPAPDSAASNSQSITEDQPVESEAKESDEHLEPPRF